MTKNLFYRMMANLHFDRGLHQLQSLERKLPSPQVRFAVPFVYRGKGLFKSIEPRQNPVEIEALYNAVCDMRPMSVLEIGTAKGGTLYLWTQAAADNATIVSIDLPGGAFGGAYPPCRIPFYRAFARQGQTLHLLMKDSHAPATIKTVCHLFNDDPIDFLFIDGDHTYEGVKADFRDYASLVRPGGIIAFHDILPRPDLPDIQVNRFWSEVREKYDIRELIGPEGSGRKIGIGLIRMGASGIGKIN